MECALPLIASGYLWLVAGLLLGFSGFAWTGIAAATVILAASGIRREIRMASLALMLLGGAMGGLESARPVFQNARNQMPEHPTALDAARLRASRSIDRLFGRDAPMARALLIADQHEIPPDVRDRYARAGMVHMLSISGLHVAIVAGAVVLLLQLIRVPRAAASIVSVLVTAVYVAVIGAPAPALRSAVMLTMVAASKATQRPTSPWASLAVGALIPLVVPRTVLDLGYQLSVVGIAGLIASGALGRRLIAPRLDGWRQKVARELLTSVVATVLTAPLIAWYFGRISLIAPLANLAAGPVIAILQPTLFLALVAAPIPGLGAFFAAACHPLLLLFDGVASVAASIPGASIDVVPSLFTVVAGGAMVLALLIAAMSRYPMRPIIVAAGSLCFVAWSPALHLPYSGDVELHVLDVGQGDAILLRTDRGRWIVFDAGRVWQGGDAGRSTIIPYVMRRGGSVVSFVLSHAHADHVGGAASVMKALHPATFWDSAFPQGSVVYDDALRAARSTGVEWHRVHAGDSLTFDGVGVKFLAPDSAWTASLSDPNSASTIALVEYGSSRFLLVGDAEEPEEEWLIDHARDDLHADVLKVGHHGSSTSSSDRFLAAVNPSLAVISVGAGNVYGHPSADVVAALARVGARVLRTDRVGTIVVHTDGHHITYEAAGENWRIPTQQ
ncbi:MAG TPA: DNA internalization-related competence protein ComEC/Rec2 [Gemmatimonadaceae bacterium]|nr:DNA internalization-related competence protein ComEC/Rec2 [Gemmatimonadaceae bacterium]